METKSDNEQTRILADKGIRLTFRDKWQNVQYRRTFFQSLAICASFLAMGAVSGQTGPTLPDLQILTHTNLGEASVFITAGAAASMAGSTLYMFVHTKVNPDLLIFSGSLLEAIATIITPFCFIYELMVFIRFATALGGGILNTSGNALLMSLWGTEGDQWMHLLHFCFAFGGVASPLYTGPFLAPKNPENETISATNYSALVNWTSDVNQNNSHPIINGETNVKYAFMISGVLTILMSLPLLPFYFIGEKGHQQKHERASDTRKLPRGMAIVTLILICIFFINYCFVEGGFIAFLMTFLIREYESVSKSQGAFVVACHWAAFACGRFLMVFLSKVISPVRVLTISIVLMAITFTGFLVAAEYAIINALIGFSVLAGIAMSGVFAAALSWTDADLLKVDGFVSATIMVSCTIGNLMYPPIFGQLMQDLGSMWFCYLTLGGTIVFIFLFVIILVYSRFLNRVQSKCDDS